jgi:hypothetical protein
MVLPIHLIAFLLSMAVVVALFIKNERKPAYGLDLGRNVGRVVLIGIAAILTLLYAGIFWW